MADTAQTTTSRRSRFWEIDLLRTVVIAMMIAYHVLYLLEYFGIRYTGVPGPYHGLWWWVPVGIASTFTFLAGASLTITYSRGKPVRGFILRGLKIFGWGMGITLLTWIIAPHDYVRFGILHLFGVAFMLAPFFLRFRYVNLILGVAIIAAGIYVTEQGIHLSSPWLLWLMPYSFSTMDYWPLSPCFGIFLLGMFCGTILYPQGNRRFSLPDFDNRIVSALTSPGRHPLVIYIAQWPALIGILLVMFPAKVLPFFPF
jgi:uncharacterized membrane protein